MGQLSICTLDPICGESGRETGEDCDNGNVAGCIDCTVDAGYQCEGAIG